MKLSQLLKALSLALIMGVTATASAAETLVRMTTSLGEVEIALDGERAPDTVANFLRYVDEGFYNGTIFHRVIDGFMIQGGGFTPEMTEKDAHEPIQNEAKNGLKNVRGTLAMARTSDPHSASAQFFVNLVDNAFLDYPSRDGWGYCVFGRVTKGMETVDRIAKVSTGHKGGMGDVPDEPVVIQSAVRVPAP